MLCCNNLEGFLCFTGLAVWQKCQTNLTATQQFYITGPSIMNNQTRPQSEGLFLGGSRSSKHKHWIGESVIFACRVGFRWLPCCCWIVAQKRRTTTCEAPERKGPHGSSIRCARPAEALIRWQQLSGWQQWSADWWRHKPTHTHTHTHAIHTHTRMHANNWSVWQKAGLPPQHVYDQLHHHWHIAEIHNVFLENRVLSRKANKMFRTSARHI